MYPHINGIISRNAVMKVFFFFLPPLLLDRRAQVSAWIECEAPVRLSTRINIWSSLSELNWTFLFRSLHQLPNLRLGLILQFIFQKKFSPSYICERTPIHCLFLRGRQLWVWLIALFHHVWHRWNPELWYHTHCSGAPWPGQVQVAGLWPPTTGCMACILCCGFH